MFAGQLIAEGGACGAWETCLIRPEETGRPDLSWTALSEWFVHPESKMQSKRATGAGRCAGRIGMPESQHFPCLLQAEPQNPGASTVVPSIFFACRRKEFL
jgi:hypothetical protein